MSTSNKPAALVIGGGIAGIQAALDIANAGYPVYLVERSPSIGGRMAQLDKTFPTLDCASCIITPKLVDIGRNPNVHLLTYSEVTHVEGEVSDFRVTVHHKPRYVDATRCVGCGACAQVCPLPVPDSFNERLSERRAIYRLFPQAVPSTFTIEREGRAPCRDACPASQRVPGYIALIAARRYEDAFRTIKRDNPFPAICGRICNHRCEDACNRGAFDEPINIHGLKRFVADWAMSNDHQPTQPVEPLYDERIAIIGAGPAGLTAAQDLALAGYRVEVFEALPVAGGMLSVGIPEFRLPKAVIDREVQDIVDLGVTLHLSTRVDSAVSLLDQGFAAVLVAVGAHRGVRLPMEGSDLPGVLINTDFLRQVRLGQFGDLKMGRVLVLGGGDVAIDCARTALRLGAESVAMACLEDYQHMPCHRWELAPAEAEGIALYNSRTFRRILSTEGHVTGAECDLVQSFSFDEAGRAHIDTLPDSTHIIEADAVIFAVGQRPELELCGDAALSPRRTLAVDPATFMTSQPGVFAAGDAVTGTGAAIDAIAAGHRAAYSIHQYLRGGSQIKHPVDAWQSLTERSMPVLHKTRADVAHLARHARQNPEHRLFDKAQPFAEVEDSLTEEAALAEAARCLTCGPCAECLQCVSACEAKAIDHNQQGWDEELPVGAIIVATGFDMFRPELKPNLGYGKYPNVMHALELERMLSASGPTSGVVRLKDGTVPHDIVFIQCVGSRDIQEGNPYCSRVCCMYTAKEAHLVRDRMPDANITAFYIDIRAFGKHFEEFHERVRHERIVYRRGNVSEVVKGRNGKLVVRAEDTLLGEPIEVEADLVILATGLVPRHDASNVAQMLGIPLGSDGFLQELHAKMSPVATERPGIFLAGACQGPKDILDTVSHARAAAASALVLMAQAEAQPMAAD